MTPWILGEFAEVVGLRVKWLVFCFVCFKWLVSCFFECLFVFLVLTLKFLRGNSAVGVLKTPGLACRGLKTTIAVV